MPPSSWRTANDVRHLPSGIAAFPSVERRPRSCSPRSCRAAIQLGSECIAIVYSFARIFRAMSCNAMRIKLLRRRAGLTITPWFQCRELILVFVFFTPVVGFPPQMTLVFISGTRRPYLERKLLTDGCIEPRLYERTGLNKGNQSSA
jgi:hypothetical protein